MPFPYRRDNMGWELEIDGVRIPERGWSGPQSLRSSYRGPLPSSREAGAASFTLFGRPRTAARGSALAFDGVDDYAQIPDAAGLELPARMAIAVWVRQTAAIADGGKGIVMKGINGLCSYGLSLFRAFGNVTLRFRQQSGSGTGETQVASAVGVLADLGWHLVIAQNDGTQAVIYVDNLQSGSADSTPLTQNCWNHGGPLTLGCSANPYAPYGRTEFSPVELAQVLLLARPLTAAERASLWNMGRGQFDAAWCQPRAAYGNLREVASVLPDRSGNGHHGQLGGALATKASVCLEAAREIARRGSVVTIGKAGRLRLRGLVQTTDAGLNDLRVSVSESAAALAEFDAGMARIGNLPNPQRSVYLQEDEPFVAAREPRWDLHGRGLRVRPGHWEPRGINPNLQRSFVFDSFHYADVFNAGDWKWRSMVWREEPLAEIGQRVQAAAALQGPPVILNCDVRLGGPRETVMLGARTENGERVELEPKYFTSGGGSGPQWFPRQIVPPWLMPRPRDELVTFIGYQPWGLTTRTIDGAECTYLWCVRDGHVRLYQLVNHGLAVDLGQFTPTLDGLPLVDGRAFPGPVHFPWPEEPQAGSYGPFMVPLNASYPHVLAFYAICGHYDAARGLYVVWAEIQEIDLRQVRNYNTDEELPYRPFRYVWGFGDPDGFAKYIVCDEPELYTPTRQPQPLWTRTSERSGGRYEDNGGSIVWRGSPWLTTAAIDFRDANLRDVLADLALVSGSEWWIDSAGTLRMERMDRAPRTATATARKLLDDRTSAGPAEPFTDLTLTGIPLTAVHTEMLRRGLTELATTNQSQRRRIRYVPAAETELPLGARLNLNGRDAGRIVAVESTLHEETVELEPLGLVTERPEQ